MAALALQESGDIGHADFHLERGRHTIEYLAAAGFVVLKVLIQIDESRSHDQPAGAKDSRAAQALAVDANDLAAGNTDVAHRIKAGLRIHDPAALDHDVVALCRRGTAGPEGQRDEQGDAESADTIHGRSAYSACRGPAP